jgi:metal-sulfur cluster biosynthetic enzyme
MTYWCGSPKISGKLPPVGGVAYEETSMAITEDAVREELKKVIDPELFVNIVDLGLVYVVNLSENEEQKTDVNIEMTLTSPMCPAGPQLIAQSKQVVSQLEAVGDVEVKVVMSPPWSPDCMTDDARDQLGIF